VKVSVIIAVYKDIEALNLIIEALKMQTYKNFEVIIAEDNNSKDMQNYINSIVNLDVKHTYQEDTGVRKSRSQNNGILKSTGEYLIFLDGDIIPYTSFIAGHVSLAKKKRVLAGRRVNLNHYLSKRLREGSLHAYTIEKYYLLFAIVFSLDRNTRFEQGIYLNQDSFIYKLFLKNRKRNTSLIGCNFSCFKEDILRLNGFDESYGMSSLADDVDLEWRFKAYGCELISCKNIANTFHLFHKKQNNPTSIEQKEYFNKNKKAKKYICDNGLNTHTT
jgi:cellulose synthase/poly-beta-1,6-N-acetylglucosamine synthase-like glycosyltransferase